jgi:hypothetical protein
LLERNISLPHYRTFILLIQTISALADRHAKYKSIAGMKWNGRANQSVFDLSVPMLFFSILFSRCHRVYPHSLSPNAPVFHPDCEHYEYILPTDDDEVLQTLTASSQTPDISKPTTEQTLLARGNFPSSQPDFMLTSETSANSFTSTTRSLNPAKPS